MLYEPKRVMNGTHGYVWLDDSLVSECKEMEAYVEFDTEEVTQSGEMQPGDKIKGRRGTGSLTLYKVTSRMIKALSEDMKANRQTEFTIISLVDDPDAFGSERIVLKGVTFAKLQLANWKHNTLGEEKVDFKFRDWDIVDSVDGSVLGG
ncbi:MAG TPA: phage tail tube protein [Bacillota bacterium]|nr:phage tail tube protein [Bacillota bacterium]